MMGRNKRGIRGTSMRVRLAVAAAVLVGGGAAGVVVASTHSSGTTAAESAGYYHNYNQTLSESTAMSTAMNWWGKSQTTSLVVITKMVTIRTVSMTNWHHKTLVVQRGTVVTKDPWEFVTKSSNDQFNLWHFNNGTKFLNIGGSKTGWNAMSGGMMSSYGSWNWSDMSNSKWNMHTKTLAKGDLVFVFGLRVHGKLQAQLVLFAAPNWSSQGQGQIPVPSSSSPAALPTPTSTMPTFAGNNS